MRSIRRIQVTSVAIVLAALVLASLGPPAHGEVPVAREVGCFPDNREADPLGTSGRDLDGAAFKDPAMTRDRCLSLCADQDFKFSGLQGGSWCFCGNSYGRYGTRGASCTTQCAGDLSQLCGGEWANGIWELLGPKSAALPGAAAPSAPTAPRQAQTVPEGVYRTASVIQLGKWPEGMAFDGAALWVAESGQRQIARIDMASRRVTRRVKVGRLPVGMIAGSDGRLFALVHTDKKVWLQHGRSGRTLARLPECPQAIAGNGGRLYVLANVGCSSSATVVYGVDTDTGDVEKISDLTANAYGIASARGSLWIVHTIGSPATISRVDLGSRSVSDLSLEGLGLYRVQSNGEKVFASGFKGQRGIVIAFDPTVHDEFRQQILSEPITALVATAAHVAAFGEGGTIWVLSADNLGIERIITTDYGPFEAKSALALDNSLYATIFQGQGQNGSVLLIDDWQPADQRVSAVGAPILQAPWRP